ncbi:MAG: type IV pilus assembly protein PilM [Candidatus Latescibacterota bacterium]
MQWFRKQASVIGLDIGSSMIKAAKMSWRGKQYFLENYSLEPIEEGAIQSGEIKNPSGLAQAALRAVRRCDPHIREVVIALPNYSILSDVLTMDVRPEKEMREAVLVEAQQVSPFDMTDVELDYAILSRDETSKKMKVLMVVAKNDIILSYVDFLGEAGLRPTVVDVDVFALTNIFHLNYDLEKYHSCVLLNIGSENTVAAFVHNGIYHSSRDISVAGTAFIRELKLIPGMTEERARGIVQGKIPADLDLPAVRDTLNNASKEFASAVDVALSYLQSSDAIEKLDLIVLSGGYAWIPGLINVLEMRTGTEVMVLDPFINIKYDESLMESIDPKRMGNLLAVAMGLATRNQ